MERVTTLNESREIMSSNFIGPLELAHISNKMSIKVPIEIPSIPFSLEELKYKQRDYILILGSSQMQNGNPLSLKSLRSHFGINPEISEPCFYNQDWYLKEEFMEKPLESKWFLIRKKVFQVSRAKNPEDIKNQYDFPSALLCAYSFFAVLLHHGEFIWENDFVWCRDLDHNGDRIYIGKYHDINRINKNGFSIHRHLTINRSYGCINVL